MDTPKVRKAVIAAAGFGTRFLPQTKAMPKEMLPIVDKPIIQYIVEELVGAGIEDIIIVTGYHKRSLEDHFDNISAELRRNLKLSGRLEILEETKKISTLANFAYIRQKAPLGNAGPLIDAEHFIDNEPFIYAYADDIFLAEPSRFAQMIELYQSTGSSVVSCLGVKQDKEYDMYGIVAGEMQNDDIIKMTKIAEKPGKDNAPSNLASVGGYLFTPSIFSFLHDEMPKVEKNKEFMVQPAMLSMIQAGHEMLGLKIRGGRFYDTGNKLEYLKTVVDFGLRDPQTSEGLRQHIKSVLQ